ncbi:hypothetical protein Ddc_11399 [Ditylenchus destructor]|nr:hypothetical protein Ddc_11399 [Ditylenchus destructor]
MKRIDNRTVSGTQGVRSSRSEYLDQLLQKQFNASSGKDSNADHQSDVLNLNDGMQDESQLSRKPFVLSCVGGYSPRTIEGFSRTQCGSSYRKRTTFLLPADDDDVRTACASESDCKTAVLSIDAKKASQISADVLDSAVGDLKAFFTAEFKRLEQLYIKTSANANSTSMERSCADEACASENIAEASCVNDSLEDDCHLPCVPPHPALSKLL